MYLTLNGRGVSRGFITLPRRGVGFCEVRVPTDEAPCAVNDPVTLLFESGLSLQMTCRHVAPDAAFWQVIAVLGKNKTETKLSPKFYNSPKLKIILQDIINECGEALDGIDAGLGLPFYTRSAMPAFRALNTALEYAPDTSWRFTREGKIRIAPESWPEGPEVTVKQYHPKEKRYVLAQNLALEPGQNIDLGYIDSVTHRISPKHLSSEVLLWTG